METYEGWKRTYVRSRTNGDKLLTYRDGTGFLRIIDSRSNERRSITLNGHGRSIYLFCDEIRSFDEIRRKFRSWDERNIRRVLDEMVKLKIMFREGDDYLSLSIGAK
jgi:hypothetical protein